MSASRVMCGRKFASYGLVIGLAIALASHLLPSCVYALTLNQPGYSATLLMELPHATYSTMDVDASGDLFIPAPAAGNILKVVPTGSYSPWAAAPGVDFVVLPSGGGYLAGTGSCNCIRQIQADGSTSILHQDNNPWSRLALTLDGTLYAMVTSGAQKGIYLIDRTTGFATVALPGGGYNAITAGEDGGLYVIVEGSGESTLNRLDGSQLTELVSLPHGGTDLTQGPGGVFYVSGPIDLGSGFATGELWIADPAAGNASLLATSGSYQGLLHPTLNAVGYDPSMGKLYVAEAYKLWVIEKDSTPAHPRSWGSVKALYRGTSTNQARRESFPVK